MDHAIQGLYYAESELRRLDREYQQHYDSFHAVRSRLEKERSPKRRYTCDAELRLLARACQTIWMQHSATVCVVREGKRLMQIAYEESRKRRRSEDELESEGEEEESSSEFEDDS